MRKPLIFIVFVFFIVSLALAQTKIIAKGDTWQYYDEAAPPPKGWQKNTPITDNWKTGVSPLGYGDSVVKTEISFGDDPEKKHAAKYFKKTFRIENPFEYIVYKLNIQKDDGIVVYLNGHEIVRIDMPNDEINNDTMATSLVVSGKMEAYVHTRILSPEELVTGINTLAVSVHQARLTSEDCIFNLELIGDNHHEMLPLLLKERTIKNLSLDAKIKELNHKQELEKKDLTIAFIERSKGYIKTSLYAIGFLLLVSLFGLCYLWRIYMKREKKLNENILGLKETNHSKDREMMSISLNSLNNQQYLKELKRNLEREMDSKADVATLKTALKGLIRNIEHNLDNDEDWTNLKRHFNAVHTGFLGKLIELHPSLSEVELRHCIFIKSHMQTKEIANILHIDPRSVQASRYRIKKKMGLDETVDLRNYLQNV